MSIEQLGGGLEALSQLLGQSEHEPDPGRTDWANHQDALDRAQTVVDAEILAPLDAALAELGGDGDGDGEEERARVRAVVADRLGDAAGLLLAAGRRDRGLQLLQRVATVGGGGKESTLATIGLADPERFIGFTRAWWLANHERMDEAREVARAISAGAPAAMAESLRTIVDAPKPLSSPPGLGTLNGFGISIYGDRDRHPNGTYVKTRFATALFVPLCPLDAYRVADADEGWYFLGKVPLARAHAWWRRSFGIALVVLLLGWGVSSYFGSEDYRLGQAIAAAEEAEQQASPEGRAAVVDQYEAILNEFPAGDPQALVPVVEAFVRLSAEDVASPLTVEQLAQARRLVARYQALPDIARRPSHAGPMIALIERWSDELGTEGHPQILAALELLGHAEAMAQRDDAQRLGERRRMLGRELAQRLAVDWPLEAIRQYVSLGDDSQALDAAAALIDELGEGPSVWVEMGPTVSRWASVAGRRPELHEIRERALARVAAARENEADPERQALMAEPDEEALQAALEAAPGDQELAVALANLRMGRGDAEGALATLTALGPPGRLVMVAQATLASLQAEAGRELEADALLERVLSNRLPAFETARRAFVEKSEAMSQRLIDDAQKGRLPASINARLSGASESEQIRIFGEWLDEQLAGDPELSRLRDEYTALSGVIDVAIQWGMIKLRRAQGTTGDERQALLDGAERAFLAIATEGQGVPSYHLGLGQVYYRLGKEEEGEREFGNLLDDEPPVIKLAVARTYRDLGLVERAREVATAVFEQTEAPAKEHAAAFLSMVVTDFEERRSWLQRAGDDPTVKLQIVGLEADELRSKGDYAAADEKYAQVAKGWSERAAADPTAANNAAVALLERYDCTGKLANLREAAELLDRARRLEPDNGVVLGNLATAVEVLAIAELLGRWLKTRQLLLTDAEGGETVALLVGGPMGTEVREAIADSPSLRRALELTRQVQVLAPRRLDSYRRQMMWSSRRRDAKGLAEISRAIEQAQIDMSQLKQVTAAYLDGSRDPDEQQRIEQRLQHFEGRRAEIERAGHAPTVAVLHASIGELLQDKAMITGDPRDARAAADAFALAHRHWPQLGARYSQAEALVHVALLEAASESVAMRTAYDERIRRLGFRGLLAWLLEDDGDALAAVRARPELGEAVALRRDEDPDALRVFDWLLAKLSQDEALMTASRPVLDRPGTREPLLVEPRLNPIPDASELILRQLEG